MVDIDWKRYQDSFYKDFKNASLGELEFALEQTILHSSNGRGQTATVPLIKIEVLEKLISAWPGEVLKPRQCGTCNNYQFDWSGCGCAAKETPVPSGGDWPFGLPRTCQSYENGKPIELIGENMPL